MMLSSSGISKSNGDLRRANGVANKMYNSDRAIHNWYRFVLSFPPHLVREYIDRFGLEEKQVILDPFCGTGTTLVEAGHYNISSVGIEANPIAHFASHTKVSWDINPDELISHALLVADNAYTTEKKHENLRHCH